MGGLIFVIFVLSMSLRALIFTAFLLFCSKEFLSQDYFSYGGGNFSGLNQVISNPAAATDNRLKLDILPFGFDFNFNNSWFAVKREALDYTGKITKPSSLQFPLTWKNSTPNVPDNVFKNFNILRSQGNKSVILENRVLLPSALYQIDTKNAIAFTWSVRQIANIDGLSPDLTYLFEKEMDLSVTQNNRVQVKNFSAVQMSWAEYGLTYARVLEDKNKHFLKAGITPKLLKGLESAYLVVKDLDFLLSTKDSNSYFNTNFSYAHSSNFKSPFSDDNTVSDFYKGSAKLRLGLDLGFIYEWRPHFQKYKYKPNGKQLSWRKDLNKYKVKFGAAIVDIGKIKFDKEGTYYDLDVSINQRDFTKFTTVKNFDMFDSIVRTDYSSKNQSSDYAVVLPTAINTQLDYAINQFFYLNLSAHLTPFHKSKTLKVHNYSAICFAPRIEHYWFDISVPFTYNTLNARRFQYVTTGLALRLGPLSIGSTNLVPLFKGDVSSLNFYAMLKVSIPYKHISDQDGDGVKDEKDECPVDAGMVSLNGCPDKDHDNIADKNDACPNQAGVAVFRGCPDTDGDGITDGDDKCPKEKGSLALKGCPDNDGDLVINKDDACPDVAGPRELKGCPDTDKDGILDKDDECPTLKGDVKHKGCLDTDEDFFHDGIDPCPTVAGPVENLGCPWPDTDKDGIIDKLDSCLTLPGVAAFKGCPEPVILAAVEKRILQKAFSSLEFETGKDVIKPTSFASLNALAKLLNNHTTDWQLKLSGHTDNEGTEEGNMLLSEQRAKAVKKYLIRKKVPENMILPEWFGQSKPIGDNTTKEGKKKNRRVEMTMLMKVE